MKGLVAIHKANILHRDIKLENVLINVVGEIKGSEKPNEIIMAGGHLDAWDNGQGAHDDGAGVVQAMEVLAMYKKQNIKPNLVRERLPSIYLIIHLTNLNPLKDQIYIEKDQF